MTAEFASLTAQYWIRHLGLIRHPEGGWYRESYRSTEHIPATGLPHRFCGERAICTAIYFLLEAGDFSALHRIKSDETWHFYAGEALTVEVITPQGQLHQILLGNNPVQGSRLQATVPAGCWFGATPRGNYVLVGCTVAPGFDFSDFELARRAELQALFPQHTDLIAQMTRS